MTNTALRFPTYTRCWKMERLKFASFQTLFRIVDGWGNHIKALQRENNGNWALNSECNETNNDWQLIGELFCSFFFVVCTKSGDGLRVQHLWCHCNISLDYYANCFFAIISVCRTSKEEAKNKTSSSRF